MTKKKVIRFQSHTAQEVNFPLEYPLNHPNNPYKPFVADQQYPAGQSSTAGPQTLPLSPTLAQGGKLGLPLTEGQEYGMTEAEVLAELKNSHNLAQGKNDHATIKRSVDAFNAKQAEFMLGDHKVSAEAAHPSINADPGHPAVNTVASRPVNAVVSHPVDESAGYPGNVVTPAGYPVNESAGYPNEEVPGYPNKEVAGFPGDGTVPPTP